jgi:hypothetical protein
LPAFVDDEHAAAHVESYWSSMGDGSEQTGADGDEDQGAVDPSDSGKLNSVMVVNKKAKMRDGIELELPSSLVGTLTEGAEVLVLETAATSDGTPRSKIRTIATPVLSG